MRRRAALALLLLAGAASSVHAQDAGVPLLVPPALSGSTPALDLPPGTAPLPDGSSVSLLLTIDATGAVTDATIDVPLRDDVDAAALTLARGLHFVSATRDGHPIPSRVRFRFAIISLRALPSRWWSGAGWRVAGCGIR